MSRDAKINLVLFTIVIILSLTAWYKPGIQPMVFHYLSTLNAEDINRITIDRQDIGQIKLKKTEHGWFLQEPYHLPANLQRVKTITALAEKRSYSNFPASNEELSRYHLDKPLVSVWLNESQFVLGSDEPIHQQRYAMNIDENTHAGQNTVHLIHGTVFYQLRANLDSFISPSLLPPNATIKSIAWGGKKLTMDDGKWYLSTDDPDVASDSIAQLIQFWKRAQASRVETNISITMTNAELVKLESIQVSLINADSSISTLDYLIIQQDGQLKLLRTDLQLAYWITPQTLKLLTEFVPIQQKT